MNIGFVAPKDGVVFIVENGELISSQSVKSGEQVSYVGEIKIGGNVSHSLSGQTRVYFDPTRAHREQDAAGSTSK